MQDNLALDVYLRGMYHWMMNNLAKGNVSEGLNVTTGALRDRYEVPLTNLGSNLSTIVPQLGTIVGGRVFGNIAEYTVERTEGSDTVAVKIYFQRFGDGEWKLSDM